MADLVTYGSRLLMPNAHGPDCCQRAPVVGARYRQQKRDIWTGEHQGWYLCTVTSVDPFGRDWFGVCRRCYFTTDCGFNGAAQVQTFLKAWQAIENVVSLRPQINARESRQ